MDRKYNILCLDGGGVTGVLTAQLVCHIEKMLREKLKDRLLKKWEKKLEEEPSVQPDALLDRAKLEKRLEGDLDILAIKAKLKEEKKSKEKLAAYAKAVASHYRIIDFFDLFAGTSAGGLLTIAYLLPDNGSSDQEKKPHFDNTEEVVKKYMELMEKVFVKRKLERELLEFCPKMQSKTSKLFLSFYDSFYREENVRQALEEARVSIKNKKLSQLMKPCIIDAHDISKAGEAGRWRFCQHRSEFKNNCKVEDCKIEGCKLKDCKL